MEKQIIGRKDSVSFPDLKLIDVPVKIDSGAYSSSMHCESIELIEKEGKTVLEVVFLDKNTIGYTGIKHEFNTFTTKRVKSSNGQAQERFFIKAKVRLFNQTFESVFSLTERTGLRNPILLGRKLLNKRFLIDPSLINCSHNFEKKNIH